jgi:hypothetical protein
VQAQFQCADGTTGAALACVSTVGLDGGTQHQLSGGLLDTSAPGSYTLHVSTTDGNGLTNSATLPYHVVVVPPQVVTDAPTSTSFDRIVMSGTVNPEGSATSYSRSAQIPVSREQPRSRGRHLASRTSRTTWSTRLRRA